MGSKLKINRNSPNFPANATRGLYSLAELLGKFHLHCASDRRDEFYALLSMANDSYNVPDLEVDYKRSWSEILHAVTRHIFGLKIKVSKFSNTDQVVILGFGCPLGRIQTFHGNIWSRSPSFFGVRGEKYTLAIDLS